MVDSGTKVSLEISEPWDAYRFLIGTVVRSYNSDDYFLIMDDESNDFYIVTARYKGDNLNRIHCGGRVVVGICIPHPELDVLAIPEISPDIYKWLNYKYIGQMEAL